MVNLVEGRQIAFHTTDMVYVWFIIRQIPFLSHITCYSSVGTVLTRVLAIRAHSLVGVADAYAHTSSNTGRKIVGPVLSSQYPLWFRPVRGVLKVAHSQCTLTSY